MNVLRLKEYRENKNMSQREVAEMLNISQASYWGWESGKASPNPKQILKLCKLFNCTPNDLFGFKGVHAIVAAKLDGEL